MLTVLILSTGMATFSLVSWQIPMRTTRERYNACSLLFYRLMKLMQPFELKTRRPGALAMLALALTKRELPLSACCGVTARKISQRCQCSTSLLQPVRSFCAATADAAAGRPERQTHWASRRE